MNQESMFKFYKVGGYVRDKLLGVESKDIDFSVVASEYLIKRVEINKLFETLSIYLEKEGYRIFLETPSCYTIRAKFPDNHVNAGLVADFVLARKEIGYIPGTRTPILEPGNLLNDLTRRDFTVNAIAMDEDGKYIDPYGGISDITNKILKTPISGLITFQDDPLRLLRAIRFAITKGFSISPDISETLKTFDYDKKFSVVSEERIREELYKCFKHDTLKTIFFLEIYIQLRYYIFKNTKLWLCPTSKLS